jgi:protein tyrosine/serine phosphatase
VTATGWVNLRDLGGHPTPTSAVRAGRLFRSDSLAHASSEDLARLVEEVGLQTVIDLRSALEVEQLPLERVRDVGIEVHHVPLLDGIFAQQDPEMLQTLSIIELYQTMLTHCASGFVAAVGVIADDRGHPLLFQCAAGKDRTGLLAALVLSTLGVDDDAISTDYARSTPNVRAIRDRMHNRPSGREVPEQFWTAEADTMRNVLAWLRARHGSSEGYLIAHGLEPDAVESLRASLLEDRAA